MLRILTFYFLIHSTLSFGQLEISGQVYSGSYLKPLKKVHLRCGNRSTKTNYEGKYELVCKTGDPIILSANQHSTQEIPVSHLIPNQANNFYLTPSSSGPFQIIPENDVEVVYWKNFEHVSDYDFVSDTLLILTYLPDENFKRNQHVNCMLSMMKYGEIISRQVVPSHTSDIFVHPTQHIFLYGEEEKFEIYLKGKQIEWKEIEEDQFTAFLDHSVHDDYVYSIEPTPIIPRVSHYIYNYKRDEKFLVRIVQDEKYFQKVSDDFEMMNSFELNLAEEVSSSTNVEVKLLAPYIRNLYKYQGFQRPYSPAFVVDNQLLIFDHKNQWLFFHDADGVAKRQTGIYHDQLLNEELVSVIQDPVTKKLYTQHDKAGVQFIRKLDIDTGASGRPYKMNHPFPKKLKIINGFVYYLYQSTIDDKKWQLVREKLPF